ETEAPPPIPAAAPPAAAVPGLLPIADAFAAAERSQPVAAQTPAWPTPVSAVSIETEAIVERVPQRVLEQLSDRIVRETVADIVASTAERLVREEIDRIKSSI